jgi:hypothetical protein
MRMSLIRACGFAWLLVAEAATANAQSVTLKILDGFEPAAPLMASAAFALSDSDDAIVVRQPRPSAIVMPGVVDAFANNYYRVPTSGAPALMLEEGKTLPPTADAAPLYALQGGPFGTLGGLTSPPTPNGFRLLPRGSGSGGVILAREKNAICIIDSELQVVWHRGDAVPGIPEGATVMDVEPRYYKDFNETEYWPHPEVLFLRATIQRPGAAGTMTTSGSLTWTKGVGLRLIGIQGDPAPDISLQFFELAPELVGAASDGTGLFGGVYTGSGVQNERRAAWFGSTHDSLKLVLGHGTTLPNLMTAPYRVWGYVFSDHTVVVGKGDEGGIWAGPIDELKTIALAGIDAEDLPAGFTYQYPALLMYGEPRTFVFRSGVATKATKLSQPGGGLWIVDQGKRHLVAWGGQPLPGEPDVTLPDIGTTTGFDVKYYDVNEHGQFVIGFGTGGRYALHRYTPGVGFELIAQGETVVSDASGKMYAITDVVRSSTNLSTDMYANQSTVFIDSKGRVIFTATFSDKTQGIVVSSGRESGEYKPYDPGLKLDSPAAVSGASGSKAPTAGSTGGIGGKSAAGSGGSHAGAGGSAGKSSSTDATSATGGGGSKTDGDSAASANDDSKKGDDGGGCRLATNHGSPSPWFSLGLLLGVYRLRRRRRLGSPR